MAKRAISFLVRQVRLMRTRPASAHKPAYSAGCEGPRLVGINFAVPMPLVVIVRNEVCPAVTGLGLKEAEEQFAPAGSVEETHCRNTCPTAGFAETEILYVADCPPLTESVMGVTDSIGGAARVTTAVPCTVLSNVDVATTVSLSDAVDGSDVGGVYKPVVALIVPHGLPLQPLPLTDQATDWLAVAGATTAVKLCVPVGVVPITSVSGVGDTVTVNAASVTVAVPVVVPSAAVATMVSVTGPAAPFGKTDGAVYIPAAEMVPHGPPLQEAPFTDHVTAAESDGGGGFVTVAPNCCVTLLSAASVTLAGPTVTTGGGTTVTLAVAV